MKWFFHAPLPEGAGQLCMVSCHAKGAAVTTVPAPHSLRERLCAAACTCRKCSTSPWRENIHSRHTNHSGVGPGNSKLPPRMSFLAITPALSWALSHMFDLWCGTDGKSSSLLLSSFHGLQVSSLALPSVITWVFFFFFLPFKIFFLATCTRFNITSNFKQLWLPGLRF